MAHGGAAEAAEGGSLLVHALELGGGVALVVGQRVAVAVEGAAEGVVRRWRTVAPLRQPKGVSFEPTWTPSVLRSSDIMKYLPM